MKTKVLSSIYAIVLAVTIIGIADVAPAQDKPADNMEIVKEKIKSDKKLLVATNMQLTESEAKTFWPVYESYQAELGKLRDREIKLIEKFAASYETMSDDVAKNLLDENINLIAISRGGESVTSFASLSPDVGDRVIYAAATRHSWTELLGVGS